MHNHEQPDGTTLEKPAHAAHAGLAGHRHSVDPYLRKQELLREGAQFRASVVRDQARLKQAIRPDAMLHAAMDRAGLALRSSANVVLKPGSGKLTALMPYAMGAVRLVRSRKIGKRGLGIAMAVALGAWFWARRSRAKEHAESIPIEG